MKPRSGTLHTGHLRHPAQVWRLATTAYAEFAHNYVVLMTSPTGRPAALTGGRDGSRNRRRKNAAVFVQDARAGARAMVLPSTCLGRPLRRMPLQQKITERLRSMGFALSSTIRPATCEPTFTLEEHEMDTGIGIHGEPERFTKKSSWNQLVESPFAVETKRIPRAVQRRSQTANPWHEN